MTDKQIADTCCQLSMQFASLAELFRVQSDRHHPSWKVDGLTRYELKTRIFEGMQTAQALVRKLPAIHWANFMEGGS